jgi:hypothetical protein
MRLWISRFFLITGFILLLYHNIVVHHHDDDDEAIEHAGHHPDDALEHVKIDHQFYQFQEKYAAPIVCITILPQLFRLPEPTIVILPQVQWLLPAEPYPPAQHSNLTILRGPPSNVNATV